MVENRFIEITTRSDMETTIVPVTQQRNSFYCPDAKHGKKRDDGISDIGDKRAEDELMWCIVRKEVVFDHDLCVNAFLEEDESGHRLGSTRSRRS